jgi:hypothetical protein
MIKYICQDTILFHKIKCNKVCGSSDNSNYTKFIQRWINILFDIIEKSKDPEAFVRLRNFGKTIQVEVVSKMLDLGLIDASHTATSMISYGGIKDW